MSDNGNGDTKWMYICIAIMVVSGNAMVAAQMIWGK